MVNKYLNNILIQMKKILGTEVGIIEGNGSLTASGKVDELTGKVADILSDCAESRQKITSDMGYTFCTVTSRGKVDYIAFIKSQDEMSGTFVEMLSSYVGNVRQMHNDKFDKAIQTKRRPN